MARVWARTPGRPSWPASIRSRLWSHLRKAMSCSASRASSRSRMKAEQSGLARSRTCWLREASGSRSGSRPGRPAPDRTQSGWARNRSESGLTISGSTHSPNSMPNLRTWSISGVRPSGQTSAATYQSPTPAVSLGRPPNQPSSSTNRSTPRRAATSASSVSRSRRWSKETASQGLSTTGRGVRGGGADVAVVGGAEAVQALGAVDGQDRRGRIGLAGAERDLGGAEQLGRAHPGVAVGAALRPEDAVPAPGQVQPPGLAGAEPEASGAGGQVQGGVVAGSAVAALPHPGPLGQAVTLGDALAAPAAGQVEQLDRPGRNGQGGGQLPDQV